jgi:hypothetical protein
LSRWFGVEFALLNGDSGEAVLMPQSLSGMDWELLGPLARQVAIRGKPEFLQDENPLVVLSMPLSISRENTLVAVGAFVTEAVDPQGLMRGDAAAILGLSDGAASRWVRAQPLWPVEALTRMSELVAEKWSGDARVRQLQREVDELSQELSSTYEEISLLYALTQHLKLSSKDEEMGQLAVKWLLDVLPVHAIAIQLVPLPDADSSSPDLRTEPVFISEGDCPLDNRSMSDLVAYLQGTAKSRPVIANPARTQRPDWPLPEVRQLILAPLVEGDKLFGWLAAINHSHEDELGSVEAKLLLSVATLLGIHSGNIELYREQAELLSSVVRALTSAIDAKDPYTCGHSDRVARVAVRLGQELGCELEQLKTIYLGGLLHDVGKIGIEDHVLRKPGRLTEAEFEHIKTHTNIGYNILKDLKKNFRNILPVVLHHHESWDGTGYPRNLSAEDIPLLARIVAVADAFDAMGSDRPYRNGMPDEKLDSVIRDGAGQQWDPEIVDAFFRARDDIRRIARGERSEDQPESQWN